MGAPKPPNSWAGKRACQPPRGARLTDWSLPEAPPPPAPSLPLALGSVRSSRALWKAALPLPERAKEAMGG